MNRLKRREIFWNVNVQPEHTFYDHQTDTRQPISGTRSQLLPMTIVYKFNVVLG